MFYWFRPLPESDKDLTSWIRFIQHDFFHIHFMKFVYLLQILVLSIPLVFYNWFAHIPSLSLIIIGVSIFIIHECIHIVVIYKQGNISLTFQGVFFWLHTDAVLSKGRFFTFMSAPFIILSMIPFILAFSASGDIRTILLFISWLNTFFSGADIINSVLILQKPTNATFYRGYYIY